MTKVYLDGSNLTLEDFIHVTRENYIVELTELAKVNINKSRAFIDKKLDENKVIYGITTGFGKFSDVTITGEEGKQLQRNLIISHACGVGEPLDEEIVRGIMLLRINALSKGYSGIRLSTINTLQDMLNKGVYPIIPEKGSLGASGDLAPLSHMVLVMMGEGEAIYKGEKLAGKDAMDKAGIETVELIAKEGLALINGTQVMTSIGAHVIYDSINLSKTADLAAALTTEALNGIIDAFDERIQMVRNHKGQGASGKNLLTVLQGSKMTSRQGELRVQDSYSIRCTPQVHGASKDCFEFVREKIEIEMNSVTDNPIIFPEDGDAISGGNFHGQPVALAFDFLGIGLAELASISERRLEKLVNPCLSNGLPAFLTKIGGLNSGFMIVQYSAASLVSENKVLAHPASVDSIPSSANQEDHVSMGTIAARKARNILENSRRVIAMEILAACQAIDLRENKGLGVGTEIVYNIIRENIETLEEDRVMYPDLDKCNEILKSNILVNKVEEKVGQLS
ncbi:MAG TPA: histidine ammonia-lyase [Tissierellaceae bacterium]|nr:histidine ammonia-lyase [Tissierellaceae bacterium]